MATKYEEILTGRPVSGAIRPVKTKALQAAFARIASTVEYEPSPTRWMWIVPGVMIVFALLIGATEWLSKSEQLIGTAEVAQPTGSLSKRPAVIQAPPTDQPEPQLSTGLWPISSPARPEVAELPIDAQSPVPEPSPKEPRYVVIAEGQSLSRIARNNHLSVKAIERVDE